MHHIDKILINRLQDGIRVCDRPYLHLAQELKISEDEILARLDRMLEDGRLSRFGPMFHAERMGGGLTLAAMSIPERDFDKVVEQVNQFPEVAHNYERNHELNMWFVLATETPEGVADTIKKIELTTGYPVFNMPKKEEFYVGLRFVL